MTRTTRTRPARSSNPATPPPPAPTQPPTQPQPPTPTQPQTPTSSRPTEAARGDAPIYIRPLRRHATPTEQTLLDATVSILTRLSPDDIAARAAPVLNDIGIRNARSWSTCESVREFGMMLRGRMFTLDRATGSTTLKPIYTKIAVAMVQTAPAGRSPDIIATQVLRLALTEIFVEACRSAYDLGHA